MNADIRRQLRNIFPESWKQFESWEKLFAVSAQLAIETNSTEPVISAAEDFFWSTVELANEYHDTIDELRKKIAQLHAKENAGFRRDEYIVKMQEDHEQRLREVAAGIAAAHAPKTLFHPRAYEGYFVYILWGEDPETPVYVGQSTNILSRISTHLGDKQKRKLTRRIQLLRCRTVDEMDEQEDLLILHYRPLLNKKVGRGFGVPVERTNRPVDELQLVDAAAAPPLQLELGVA